MHAVRSFLRWFSLGIMCFDAQTLTLQFMFKYEHSHILKIDLTKREESIAVDLFVRKANKGKLSVCVCVCAQLSYFNFAFNDKQSYCMEVERLYNLHLNFFKEKRSHLRMWWKIYLMLILKSKSENDCVNAK